MEMRVTKVAPFVSSAYDAGATAAELRRGWRAHFEAILPKD
jgi:hypothetical protein